MKSKFVASLLLVSLIVVGCGDSSDKTSDSYEPPISVISSYVPPTSIDVKEEVVLDIFGLNDLHGSIEYLSGSQTEYGMYKIGSYLRAQEALNPGGVINVDAGDMWQGSADSNITNGKVLVEMLNSLNWAATTLGNHEFDWYDTTIAENRELAEYPFLGANIKNKTTGAFADNLVDAPSVMIERNGVKVGIIGTVGSRLESSILPSAVANYSFEPVTNYIINESNKLRADGANLIILLTHDSLTGYSSSGEYGPILEPSGNREPLVDVVFTGHEHAYDRQLINGVPILQTNGNSKQLMHVNLTVSQAGVEINTYELIDDQLLYMTDDAGLQAVYAKYSEEISFVKDEVVGELTSYLGKTPLVKLANRTMLEAATEVYPVDVAIHNFGGVRVSGIDAGEVTFGDIYKAFPFDNTVVIVKNVPGSEVSAAMGGNGSYLRPGLTSINPSGTYNVVTINYISESNYNNFKSYQQSVLENVFVRDLVAGYFRTNEIVDPSQI